VTDIVKAKEPLRLQENDIEAAKKSPNFFSKTYFAASMRQLRGCEYGSLELLAGTTFK
jgi:hypothetical protein